MTNPVPGEIVVVDHIPDCDFCSQPGPYDFKTSQGPWAHGCMPHWLKHRASTGLGVGKGQLWITADQVDDATE